ncbi:MAG: RHS repeat-associated core domain-containing protein [Pseudomonadota bacterium]
MRTTKPKATGTAAALLACALAGAQDAPTTSLEEAINGFVDPEGRPAAIVTGAFGEALEVTDSAGLNTAFRRDARGNPLTVAFPSGATFDSTYDGDDNLTSQTDRTLGGTSTYVLDETFARVIQQTNPRNDTATIELDRRGNRIRAIAMSGLDSVSEYNGAGLPTFHRHDFGLEMVVEYTADMNIAAQHFGTGGETRSVTRTYSPAGYLTSLNFPEGRSRSYAYDVMGRVVQTTFSDGTSATMTHNEVGQLSSLTTPAEHTYEFAYTSAGLLSNERLPDVGAGTPRDITYAYNAARQLTEVRRPDDLTTVFEYDTAGRLSTVRMPESYALGYDEQTGLLSTLSSPSGISMTYAYDGYLLAGVAFDGALVGQIGYTYDVEGAISSVAVAGVTYNFQHNAANDVVQAGDLQLTYDATTGLLTGSSLGIVQETYGYNQFAEMTRHTVTAGAEVLYDAVLTRDLLGRVIRRVETIEGSTRTVDLAYDAADRLLSETVDGSLVAVFTYDANGNRLDGAATYDARDRVLALGSATFSHSGAGELMTRTEGPDITQYGYDTESNLTHVTLPEGSSIRYLQDGIGRRVAKQVNGVTQEAWLYSGRLSLGARLDGSNNVLQRYVYAEKYTAPAYIDDGQSTYKVISDQRGSVRLVVDSSDGTVVQRIDYGVWGDIEFDSNPGFQPFGFAGGLYDQDTGLTYFNYRDYDASTGRWMTADPSGFVGSKTNLYAYVDNDPINLIDPMGMEDTPARGPLTSTPGFSLPNPLTGLDKQLEIFTKPAAAFRYAKKQAQDRDQAMNDIVARPRDNRILDHVNATTSDTMYGVRQSAKAMVDVGSTTGGISATGPSATDKISAFCAELLNKTIDGLERLPGVLERKVDEGIEYNKNNKGADWWLNLDELF